LIQPEDWNSVLAVKSYPLHGYVEIMALAMICLRSMACEMACLTLSLLQNRVFKIQTQIGKIRPMLVFTITSGFVCKYFTSSGGKFTLQTNLPRHAVISTRERLGL